MLRTEERNPATTHLDRMSVPEMLEVINRENENAVRAVQAVLPQVAEAVEAASASLAAGGRLFYLGCGTSGRLGVLDASECPPTFGVSPDRVVGIIAGGDRCLRLPAENAEDSGEAGEADLKAYAPERRDTVVGLSVAGGAEYVLSALRYAKSLGCMTVGITSNPDSALADLAEISVCPDTGPEPLTGSTRMKAGTAQKLILNMISTCAMVQQGYVYENLMVNLRPTNRKLRQRVIRIVTEITGASENDALAALETHDWVIRDAADSLQG